MDARRTTGTPADTPRSDITTSAAHYEQLLAEHYTWMFGAPIERKAAEQAELLRDMGVTTPGLCVDLGCGPGFQAIALAQLGATRVHAIDTSAALLAELRAHAGNLPVTPHEGDLMTFDTIVPEGADTIVCMGDTLTHLGSAADIVTLARRIAGALSPRGRLLLSWRDLSAPPAGLDRFIPIRATDERIMTCFLEDAGDVVLVHDLIYVKHAGAWQLRKSAYPKLKLPAERVVGMLGDAGLAIEREETRHGMAVLAAVKP